MKKGSSPKKQQNPDLWSEWSGRWPLTGWHNKSCKDYIAVQFWSLKVIGDFINWQLGQRDVLGLVSLKPPSRAYHWSILCRLWCVKALVSAEAKFQILPNLVSSTCSSAINLPRSVNRSDVFEFEWCKGKAIGFTSPRTGSGQVSRPYETVPIRTILSPSKGGRKPQGKTTRH